MSALRWAGEIFYGLYAGLMFCCFLAVTCLLVKLAPNRATAARITSASLRTYFALAGCPVRVHGREYWEMPGPRVIVSNHTSNADVLVLLGALGSDYHFVAKQEVYDIPFIGTFMRKLGHFAFDRSNPQARLRQGRQIEQALRKGESVYLFPEGTFTAQPGVRPFKLGAFKAATSAHCPVLPVALSGIRRFLRDGSYLPRRSEITITICAPVSPEDQNRAAEATETESAGSEASSSGRARIVELRDRVRETIAREVGEPLL